MIFFSLFLLHKTQTVGACGLFEVVLTFTYGLCFESKKKIHSCPVKMCGLRGCYPNVCVE